MSTVTIDWLAAELPIIQAPMAGSQASRQLRLGAAAVPVGTAFLLCPEATTIAVHRTALASDAARHTTLTNLFSGRPARGIVNRLMRELGALSAAAPDFPLATGGCAAQGCRRARGLGDFSPLWAGENATGCKPIPAAEIIRQLAGGCST